MFQNAHNPNPGMTGNAGTLLTISLMQKLVEKGALSKADAHEVVQGALKLVEGVNVSWAKASRELLTEQVLPAFPQE